MRVEIIPCLQDNFSYLIIDDSNNTACIVDPSEAAPIINFLKNKSINLKFFIKYNPENRNLKKKAENIKKKIDNGLPTIPSTIKDELECNIFLRANDLESFSKLRDLKDNF